MSADKNRSPFNHGPSTAAWTEAHEAMKADELLWRLLRLDGVQSDGFQCFYEIRSCPRCQSTIFKAISYERVVELCLHVAKFQAQALEALNRSFACVAGKSLTAAGQADASIPPSGRPSP